MIWKAMKKFLLLLFSVLSLPVCGQGINNYYLIREARYAEVRSYYDPYVDCFPDTLCYQDSTYFFRTTPFYLKTGYTEMGIPFAEFVGAFPSFPNEGNKGYTLTWFIRNDSLFIKNVTRVDTLVDIIEPTKFLRFSQTNHHEDSVLNRIEDFVGRKSQDGVLFVDWITGNFGVLRSFKWTNYSWKAEDDRKAGLIFNFKKGKLVSIKKDKRKIKN